ncbi:hypothetical protein BS17DRAFT_488268 [Gyrodon lividus]|nr:hypothetical protein BS17DRAFT_488268 [Gyrodon lividus]
MKYPRRQHGFHPIADDLRFDQIDHTYCYESFSWQDDFDPDCERNLFPRIVRHDDR